jgi:hypothetical protein
LWSSGYWHRAVLKRVLKCRNNKLPQSSGLICLDCIAGYNKNCHVTQVKGEKQGVYSGWIKRNEHKTMLITDPLIYHNLEITLRHVFYINYISLNQEIIQLTYFQWGLTQGMETRNLLFDWNLGGFLQSVTVHSDILVVRMFKYATKIFSLIVSIFIERDHTLVSLEVKKITAVYSVSLNSLDLSIQHDISRLTT